jgi:hypothetical protein
MKKLLSSLERNEVTYWLGLLCLLLGLGQSVSMATALCVVGGVLVLESITTSYLATWMAIRKGA